MSQQTHTSEQLPHVFHLPPRKMQLTILLQVISLSWFSPIIYAEQTPFNTPITAQDVKQLETVQVVGRRTSDAEVAIGKGQSHNTVAITQKALLSAPAGTSGLKMLEHLAGFNVQTNDALGLYEFGNSVAVRAFNFQQIGFVLDGIPMSRNDAFGGSPIFRYVDNENTSRVIASTGTGDVSFPSYISLGPVAEYQTLKPSSEAGGSVVTSFGGDHLKRTFIKLETGEHQGWSAYLSRSKIDADLWRGPGAIDREHIEAKARYEFDAGHELNFKVVYNDFDDYDVPGLNYAKYHGLANDYFGRSGRSFGYLDYLPNLPETVAGIPFSHTHYNQYYKLANNQRRDVLYGLSGLFLLSPNLENKTTLYYEDKKGTGVSPEAYATSLANHNAQKDKVTGLFAPKGLQYGISRLEGERYGASSQFKWRGDAHTIETGLWAEKDSYQRQQARYNLVNGNPTLTPLFNQPVHLQRDFESTREVLQLNIKDTWQLNDQWALTAGVKALDLDYRVSGYRNPADYIAQRQPTLNKNWQDYFLPYLGVLYKLNTRDELFASWSENLALPRGADDIFTQSAPTKPLPQAEKSQNIEIGYRLNHPQFNASLASYYTTFDNRIQPYASPVPGSTQTETWYQNVGKSQAWGAELSGIWKPEFLANKVYFNGNLTFNKTELKDDLTTLKIKGNHIPDSPEWMAQLGATYEFNDWLLLNLSAKHIAKRYTNLTNTETLPSFTLANAYIDVGSTAFKAGPLKDIKVRFNIDNLFDKDYIGTVLPTVDTPAVFLSGPERSYQASLSFSF